MPAQAQQVVEEKRDPTCNALTQHKTINDATYQAGVDVNGNAVTPANLVGAPSIVKNVTRIPLTVDLAERLEGIGAFVENGLDLDANFGILEIHQDGRVMFEGQDWTNNLSTLCGQSHKVMVEEKMPEEVTELPFVETPPPVVVNKEAKIKTKIVTNKPELIPDEILQGGEYRE